MLKRLLIVWCCRLGHRLLLIITIVLPYRTVVAAIPIVHHDFLRRYILVLLQGVVWHKYMQLSFQLLMIHVIIHNLFSDYAAIATLETILPIVAYWFFAGDCRSRSYRFFRSFRSRRRRSHLSGLCKLPIGWMRTVQIVNKTINWKKVSYNKMVATTVNRLLLNRMTMVNKKLVQVYFMLYFFHFVFLCWN